MSTPDFSWVKDMKAKAPKISEETIKEVEAVDGLGKTPMDVISFVRVERDLYNAESATKGRDLVFHFFPKMPGAWPTSAASNRSFEDVMGDAFIEVFKFPERLQAAFAEELDSWAVRAVGWGDNFAADVLVSRVYEALDRRLRA